MSGVAKVGQSQLKGKVSARVYFAMFGTNVQIRAVRLT